MSSKLLFTASDGILWGCGASDWQGPHCLHETIGGLAMGFPRMDTGFDKFRASEPQNRQGDYNRSAGRMQLVAGADL